MSQAIAALEGIRASLRGEPLPIGYLLGTRCLSSTSEYLPLGTEFEVVVEEIKSHSNGLAYFSCAFVWDDNSVRCDISVFRKSA